MQKARRHPDKSGLRPLVSVWFQSLFTPFLRVLFTLPYRDWCTIGHQRYLALEGGPPRFPQDFPDLVVLRIPSHCLSISYTGLSPSMAPFPKGFSYRPTYFGRSYNPGRHARRFRLFRFRSPLLTESRLISFPPGTEMFQFPGCASSLRRMTRHNPGRVSPFGHLRI